MGHLLGYARVSTTDQDAALQTDALAAAGCWRVWTDHVSGLLSTRPQLDAVLDAARAGDTLVVWRLDRLGRSLRNLIDVVGDLEHRGVGLRSLQEAIDTTTPGGRLVFHVFGAVAQFERDLIVERTQAGLAAARARGRVGGRKPALTPQAAEEARRMYEAKNLTIEQIAKLLGCSRSALYRSLRQQGSIRPVDIGEAASTPGAEDAP